MIFGKFLTNNHCRLTDSLLKNKKDFAKTAISAVGDFITALIGSRIEDAIKVSLFKV